jgi:uncharacterized protein YbjT (DUF2867 family)
VSDSSVRKRIVLLAGATGLVGGECLRLLSSDDSETQLRAIIRRHLPPKLRLPGVSEHVVDFDKMDDAPEIFRVDQVFCALGTTIRKAGSQEAFRRVDYDYSLMIASLALEQGAKHFLLVSSLGANAGSHIFYNRVKGELEEAIIKLGYRSVTIARPSLLLGERDEFRLGEEIGKRIYWLLPKKWQPVQATQVASSLVNSSKVDSPGIRIFENSELITK